MFFLARPSMPILLPTLPSRYSKCAFHVKHSSITTPRYLYSETRFKSLPLTETEKLADANFESVPKGIHSVFPLCIKRLLLSSHSLTLASSLVRVLPISSAFLAVTQMTVSSACIKMLHSSKTTGRSLIKSTNSNGPSIDPCGTSDVMVQGSDNSLPKLTTCQRPVRQLRNQFNSVFESPHDINLLTNNAWSTESNALRRSTKTPPVSKP